MHVRLITPAPAGTRLGNRVTALRWARHLRDLGHRATIAEHYLGEPCDVLIALHAKKSAAAVSRIQDERPEVPVVVALSGTDLYRDLARSTTARRSLRFADRLIVLQRLGVGSLPAEVRDKARVIVQSAEKTPGRRARTHRTFDVCVLGHLRAVKDPFRTAMAVRTLPKASRIRVLHVGGAHTPAMAWRATKEQERNDRYRWFGDVPRWRARRILARSRVMVLSSKMEGGANVLVEALADGVPVLASRIEGSVGLLGEDYPGFFPVGDTRELTRLLRKVEEDEQFLGTLREACRRLAPMVEPAKERDALASLLCELKGPERLLPA